MKEEANPSHEERWQALETAADDIASKDWPMLQSLSAIAAAARDLEVTLPPRGSEQLLEAADRRRRPTSEPILPGESFAVTAHPWAVDGVFRHGLNLLVGQPGAGKSRLAASLAHAWLRGDPTWLDRTLAPLAHGEQRHCLIVGVDQGLEDWAATLAPVGLATRNGQTVTLHSRVILWPMDTGIQLDPEGLRRIRAWADDHPGGLVIVDSLAACLPAGVDPDRAGVRRPIQGLAEAIGTGWGLLLHHTRKGAGKDRNLGVGAGSGSAQIDAAVSRVVGLGLIHKMEGGVAVPQEADPRRELLSTKRGGASLHLVIASDETGNWRNHGSAEALKQQEREERVRANLTERHADVLAALEAADGWLTVRDLSMEQGEQYDPRGSAAALTRKVLARLENLGLIESKRVGVERTYRAKRSEEISTHGGDEMSGSLGSHTAVQGISPVHPLVHTGSHPREGEPGEPEGEPAGEPPKSQSAQEVNHVNHPPPAIPCRVNGQPGWTRPPGPMCGPSFLVTDPTGRSRLVGRSEVADVV
jgi:hypothetical protein